MTKTLVSIVVAMGLAIASASTFAMEPKKHKKTVAHQHHMVTHHHHMKPMEPKPAAPEQKQM